MLTSLFSNRTPSQVSSDGKVVFLHNIFRLIPSTLKSNFNFLQWSDRESYHFLLSDPRYQDTPCKKKL